MFHLLAEEGLGLSLLVGGAVGHKLRVVGDFAVGPSVVVVVIVADGGQVRDGEDEGEGDDRADGAHDQKGKHEAADVVQGGTNGGTCRFFADDWVRETLH